MRKLIILGAGGHGRVLRETATAANRWASVFHLDDDVASDRSTVDVVGPISELQSFDNQIHDVALGVGNNSFRLELATRCMSLGFAMPPVLHPAATVSPSVKIGAASVIFAGAVVCTGSVIGMAVIVNHGAIVDHDCKLEDGVHISPGVSLAGGVHVGRSSWIGVGVAVRDRVNIGSGVIAGAGAAIVSDVRDGTTVVGVPAREINAN